MMTTTTTRQLCTFYVDGRFFGVDVTRVQEVIRDLQMTRVPLATRVIRGLINLRGQIVTAIDMRARLGLEAAGADAAPPMNVVVRTEDGAVSLLVDEIGDVVEVDDGSFERLPETLDATSRELIGGVYKLKGKLLLVLDADRTVDLGGAETPREQANH
jgi:purine-binding chemotaxis protein CheW